MRSLVDKRPRACLLLIITIITKENMEYTQDDKTPRCCRQDGALCTIYAGVLDGRSLPANVPSFHVVCEMNRTSFVANQNLCVCV